MSLRSDYISALKTSTQGSFRPEATDTYIRFIMNKHLQLLAGLTLKATLLYATKASKPSELQLKPSNLCSKFGLSIDKALTALRNDSGALASLGNYSEGLRTLRDILRSVSTRKQRILSAVLLTLKKAYLNKLKALAYL